MKNEELILALKEIDEKLKNLNWVILSGLAVKIYANSDREINDIDIIVPDRNDFLEAAKRFGKKAKKRFLEKQGFTVIDHGFELVVQGISVEITGGVEEMKFKDMTSGSTVDKEWLEHVQEKEFCGLKLRLQPLEDLIIQKIVMNRKKDKKDLESLSKLKGIDIDFLKRDAERWNCLKKVISALKL